MPRGSPGRSDESHPRTGSWPAPGPDGLDAEIYKHSPCLIPYTAALFSRVCQTGFAPTPLRIVHMVAFLIFGKGPRIPSNKRPISLVCGLMEVFEQVIYNRIVQHVEPQLNKGQFACSRPLGANYQLAMLSDFTHCALPRNGCVCVVSYDIASASDCISRSKLIRALQEF